MGPASSRLSSVVCVNASKCTAAKYSSESFALSAIFAHSGSLNAGKGGLFLTENPMSQWKEKQLSLTANHGDFQHKAYHASTLYQRFHSILRPCSAPRIQLMAYAFQELISVQRIVVVYQIETGILDMLLSRPVDVLELLVLYGWVWVAIGFFHSKFVHLKRVEINRPPKPVIGWYK